MVDGANVVGSRPDGWWRDRPGAARRLHDRLVAASLGYDEVVLVLEGQARRGVAAGRLPEVTTVHAAGEGDDTVVGEVRRRRSRDPDPPEVQVVTADRELCGRVIRAGGGTRSPGWLLDRL